MKPRKREEETSDVVEELSTALEELQTSTEEMRVQNEELLSARNTVELERQKYRELFEFAPDGYLITDCNGTIRDSNEAAAVLLGVKSMRLLGKPISVYVSTSDHSELFKLLDLFSTTQTNLVRDFQLEIRPRARNIFSASITIKAIRSDSGTVTGLRWLVRDDSERRRQEKELAANARLLQAKHEELEQWASATAHDLKEPIRIMALYSGMLQDKFDNKLGEEGEIYLNFISGAATKAMSLIQDLLTFKMVTSTGNRFAPTPLNRPLNEAMVILKPALRESKGEIIFEKLPTVLVDESQCVQLFYNLLNNGIKFHGDTPPAIKVSAHREKNDWVISVADNGIGFDAENAEKIFVMFERLEQNAFPGNGIGLALCKKIVENHGGEIWAAANKKGGSVFSIRLPAIND
ncbi:MAG: ATP-binding protein [Candidatus Melainabacteria bacterium]|nr:ATP-binding protein [Candidatus Melainabacteria bacterium]